MILRKTYCLILLFGIFFHLNSSILAADSPKSTKTTKPKTQNTKPKQPITSTYFYKKHAIGLDLGWEALFGNGIYYSYRPFDIIELSTGLGYTLSGVRFGVSPRIRFNIVPSIALFFATTYNFSTGSSSEVSVDAQFTPENATTSESLIATQKYTLSPVHALGFSLGSYFLITTSIRLTVQLGYNLPVAGNQVQLNEKILYNKSVEITNEDEFKEKLAKKSQELVKSGGISGSFGLSYLF